MGQTGARDVRNVRALHTAAVFTAVIKPHLPLIRKSNTNDLQPSTPSRMPHHGFLHTAPYLALTAPAWDCPCLLTAAEDDRMIVIDCADCLVLPSRADFTDAGTPGTLPPGNRANIAVIRIADLARRASDQDAGRAGRRPGLAGSIAG